MAERVTRAKREEGNESCTLTMWFGVDVGVK